MAKITGTNLPDTITGTAGDDGIRGRGGDDIIFAGDGNDGVNAGAGDDLVLGEAGNDTLGGDGGNDTLDGGSGDDRLNGGIGDDSLLALEGDDTLIGGTGNDRFYIEAGNHDIIGGEDADGNDIDVLDLSGAGNYSVTYTGPESGIIHFFAPDGSISHTSTFKEIERVICFTPGTMIATMRGECPVETLAVGDQVFTRDNGAQAITWIGRKKITLGAGTLSQKLQPILIRKGALGFGLPENDLLVSPNHRVLLTPKIAEMVFEEREVLVAAKHLVGMPGVEFCAKAEVEYVHFLCEGHEVILSNGSWTETFQPGDYSMGALGKAQRDEIFALFPELKTREKSHGFSSARKTLKRYEAELLVASGH